MYFYQTIIQKYFTCIDGNLTEAVQSFYHNLLSAWLIGRQKTHSGTYLTNHFVENSNIAQYAILKRNQKHFIEKSRFSEMKTDEINDSFVLYTHTTAFSL